VSTLAPLRLAPFRNLAAGRVISMLGNAMAPIALAFAVLDLTGSARDLGLVVGARSLTNVVFLLFGGVVADRFPRQRVMVVSSVLAAVTQAAVAALVLTGSATIGLLIGLAALNGLVSAFAFPAAAARMGQTVPDEIRKQANALSRLGIGAAMIVGAAAAGLLVAEFNAGWVIAIDAFTFSVAALFFALVRVPPVRDTSEPRASTIHELRVGWAEFVSRTWLWVVVLGFMFFNAAEVGAISVLGPVMADAEFGRRGWGFVLAAQTAGLVAGALIAMRIRVRRLLFVGVLCTFVGALLPAAMAIIPVVWVLVAVAFATGVAIEQFGIAWETSMQEHVPQDKLARVYSYDALGSFIAIPIGQVAAGPAAEAFGSDATLLAAGAIIVLAVAGMLLSRDVRTLEHLPTKTPDVAPAPAIVPLQQPDVIGPDVIGPDATSLSPPAHRPAS
jgi:MFS family permease